MASDAIAPLRVAANQLRNIFRPRFLSAAGALDGGNRLTRKDPGEAAGGIGIHQ